MGDSTVPAGRLVFWTPVAPDSAWADDPRAPALVHEHHVRAAAARGPRHVDPAWVGVSFGVGRVGRHQVGAALSAWLRGHEHLRSTLVPTGEHCARRTLPAGALTLRREEVGDFADGASVRRQIEAFFDRGAGPLGWPQVVFATVEGVGGTTVFAGADHGIVDGYTLALIPGQIRGLLADRAEDIPRPTFLDFGAEERGLVDRLPRGPEHVDRWRTFCDAHGNTPAFPLPLGAFEVPLTQCSSYRRLLDGPAATRFAAAARAGGGTTAAGLLACLALAAAEVAGERQLSVVSLANTRPGQWRAAPGWFVGLHPVRIPVTAGSAFADTVALAAAELRRGRPGPGSSLPHLSRMLRREIRPRFVVSYLDVRRVAGTSPPRPEDMMLRSRIHSPAEVYVWLTRGDRGVHLSTRFPDTAVARANVGRFVVAAAHAAARVAQSHRAEAVPTPA
ncbi:hypothetical protein [Streptomyces sp. NPDC046261]|uniref:hypothetical protein n=1 Tax=Streptomyces sp. NPDC046261 TaxID=3157200 RepID=UPI00340717AE